MSKNKQLAVNMLASLTAFFVSAGISFLLSPYIVETVGTEAYGFVQLSNNMISYFSILTIALNSMSSRFISVSYFQGSIQDAKEYYSSTFYADLLLCILFAPLLGIGIRNISRILNISSGLILDVKYLMGFMAVNFLIGLLATNLGVSYYIKNKLYLSSAITILGNIIRALLLVAMYCFFPPFVAYTGAAALIVTIITQSLNIWYKKKLIPELNIKWRDCRFGKIKIMVTAGIWNTVTRVGGILQDGLDLLITNLMISPGDMGILAIAKTIPTLISTLISTLINVFIPNLTELYAQERREELVADIKQAMKIMGMFLNIPVALLIGFGRVLFELWYPSLDADMLQRLSMLSILPWIVMGPATIIHNVFTVVNRIKVNSILVCITGFLSVITVGILLQCSIGGIYAVAGVSSVYSILRNVLYTLPFGAKYLDHPWYTFFPEVVKEMFALAVLSGICYGLSSLMPAHTWLLLIIFGCAGGIIGVLINLFIVLGRDDRNKLCQKIKGVRRTV